ncbi:MAG: hypothetical protein KJ709_04935 [Nanoarchaeota archaeon]|nr:hypothetical protein [Nanoarchaeota archaeon]
MRGLPLGVENHVYAAQAESFVELYRFIVKRTKAKDVAPDANPAYLGMLDKYPEGIYDPIGVCVWMMCPGNLGKTPFYISKYELIKHKNMKGQEYKHHHLLMNEIVFILPSLEMERFKVREINSEPIIVTHILREHELKKNLSKLEQAAQDHFHRLEERRKQMEWSR